MMRTRFVQIITTLACTTFVQQRYPEFMFHVMLNLYVRICEENLAMFIWDDVSL